MLESMGTQGGGTVVVGGVVRSYRLRRSCRAKRVLLQVDMNGVIEVVVPRRVSYREAEKFVQEKHEWLARALANFARRSRERPRRVLANDVCLPLLGDKYTLRVVCDSWRRRSSFDEEKQEISIFVTHYRDVRVVLMRWYKKRAWQYFEERSQSMAAQLGVSVCSLTVSDARSQWGSCIQATGRVSLHWRLLLGPREIADYVIAHEVAHLKERRHTVAFWHVVEQLDSRCSRHRAWLKKYGHTLVL